MMRIAVTGSKGQVATSLIERAGAEAEVVALGRPAFDLADRASVLAGLEAARPDVIVNAAAYTAVDKAEAEEAVATRVNGEGAGHVAEAAARLGVPLLHLSTDYVFDGALDRALSRGRSDRPDRGLWALQARRREARSPSGCENSVILRTAWVYSPFGANFVRTMLRLNETRDEVGVVADQRGNPTSALDIADALVAIAARVEGRFVAGSARRLSHDRLGRGDLGGFRRSRLPRGGGARAAADPRQAHCDRRLPDPRPQAGQLPPRQRKAARVYGLRLPDWRRSVAVCCARLLPDRAADVGPRAWRNEHQCRTHSGVLMQRKVLVTGGAGFIGSAVCRRLVGEGASVLNLDALTYAGNLQSLARSTMRRTIASPRSTSATGARWRRCSRPSPRTT